MKRDKRSAAGSQPSSATDVEAGKAGASRWTPDLSGAGRTKYLALVDSIREAIVSGELADAERLPTQRALARQLGVNIATVTKAIAEAGRLGLVATRRGGGTHVVGRRGAASAAPEENSGVVDLSINIPPVALVKPILDDVIATLAQRRRGEALFEFAPLGGAARDRAAGCSWVATRGLKPSVDRLLVTQGAHEGLFAALTAATQPGDVVLCENLNYTGIRRLGDLCRVRLVGVATDHAGLLPDALAEACEAHAPKAIVCTPVTLNPTTATQDLERRRALLAIARRYSTTVIEDDIYGHLSGDATPPLAALWPEGVIYVCGLSKCVAPGLRLGYLLAPQPLVGRLRDALVLLTWMAPSLQAAIATEMIEGGMAESCAGAHRRQARMRMALAHGILGSTFVAGAAATYHGWLHLPVHWRPRDFTAALQRNGILVSPAQHFLIGEGEAPSAIRLSLGGADDVGVLERALQAIAGVLDSQALGVGSIV